MEGYIYCLSNKSLPGLLKIGSTNNCPQQMLIEHNIVSENLIDSYVLELSKNVFDYKKKETMLLLLLNSYEEFAGYYKIELDKVEILFDMFDEVSFVNNILKENDFVRLKRGRRKKLSDYFEEGQQIRHIVERGGLNHEWIGEYNSEYDGIYYNNCILTLKQFVSSHCESMGKKPPSNIWKSCEYFKNDLWISFQFKESL